MTNTVLYSQRPRKTKKSRQSVVPYLFIAPFFLLFCIFGIYPILFSIVLSFQDWNGAPGAQQFVGLDNYNQLFKDNLFWESMLNTVLIFVMHFPVMMGAGLGLAVILNQNLLRFQGLWRALIFLPQLTSMVAAGITFRLIFEGQSGIANRLIGYFGIAPVPWLDDVWWARVSISILLVWAWTGYQMVLFLAALQNIPPELNEAAMVDGANRLQVFWNITLPFLRPVMVFMLTVSVIGTFALYTEPTILTGGGPIHSTTTPTMEISGQAFANLKYGYAASLSYAYFAVVVVVTVLQNRLTAWWRS